MLYVILVILKAIALFKLYYVKQLNKFMFGKLNFNNTWSVLPGL